MAGPAGEGNARGQDAFHQVAPRGDPEAPVVDVGAAAPLGPEHVAGNGVVGHRRHHLPLALQGDVDGEVWDGVQEVGRPVERIDDEGVGLVGALDHAPLLA